MEEKAVTTISRTDVHFPITNGPTSATPVSRSTLLPNVVLVAQSPLHLNNFHKYLANHPDQAWCHELLKGIEQCMDIGFEGERTSIILDKWKSALEHPEVITEYLANEVAAGCKGGPFTQHPFLDMVGSLMGIVTKKCSLPVEYRITHNLSWPPQNSVNDHIDPDAFRCFCGSFDDAVALIIKHGVGTLSATLDWLGGCFQAHTHQKAGLTSLRLIMGSPMTRWLHDPSLFHRSLSPLWAAQLPSAVQQICRCPPVHHESKQSAGPATLPQ